LAVVSGSAYLPGMDPTLDSGRGLAKGPAVKLFILIVALFGAVALASAQPALDPSVSPTHLMNEVEQLVRSEFYDKAGLADFDEAEERFRSMATDRTELPLAVGGWLATLHASHTFRYTPDSIDYYELSDIFARGIGRRLRTLFPPRGEIMYPGIGIVPRAIDGKIFVADVYDGTAAARAGVESGDEIVSVDGGPYREVGSFAGKVGETVTLELRRAANAAPVTLRVAVQALRPNQTLANAIRASARVIEAGGRRIGYLRLWSFAGGDAEEAVMESVASEPLESTDGLILDMRGRWGGAPADATDIFVGKAPLVELVGRGGEAEIASARWRKPVVGIIDEGSRSGMEILAYGLKRSGVRLVGVRTAGAVLAGRAFRLSDNSLMLLAVADVRVDGQRLEGVGVMPDIEVPYDIRYSAGADPQLERAIIEMSRLLAG
jgi:carboxyl-terminal processing protease